MGRQLDDRVGEDIDPEMLENLEMLLEMEVVEEVQDEEVLAELNSIEELDQEEK